MKKNNLGIILITIAAVIICAFCFTSPFGNNFDESNEGKKVFIEWEAVNVREEHSISSEVIVTLEKWDTVILTGNSYEYVGGRGYATDTWTEVQLSDGKIGWVVTRSIDW